MVKEVKIAIAFLRLIRIPNLVMIAVTQYFMRWFILKPLLGVSDFTVQLDTFQFASLVVATVLIAAAGYIINDYFDSKADLINRPGRVIIGRLITRRWAMTLHVVFTAIGILSGAYLAMSVHKLGLVMVFVFTSGVLWFYSTTYKRQLLIGNILISVLVGLVPLTVILFEFPLLVKRYALYTLATGVNFDYLIFWIVSYSVFAFMVNLIREIIKDMEDFEGDYIFGRQTVPIVWGMKMSSVIICSLIVITIVPIIYILINFLFDKLSLVYITGLILIPFLYIGIRIFLADSKKEYHTLSQLIKLIMLGGLLYCPLVTYIIHSIKV